MDEYALQIQGLSKKYDNDVEALRGVDLEVQNGDFFGLLGANGAGKSTLIGILSSLVRPSAGTVRLLGHDIRHDFSRARRKMGVVPQEFNFNNFERIEDILVNQAGYYGIRHRTAVSRAEKYLRLLNIWGKRNDVARELSGGMKRRLMIARALVHEPQLLILDEPTAGVDIELRRFTWEFLRERNRSGVSIILTTHYLEEAESLCRNLAIIDDGRIIRSGGMREALQSLKRQTFLLDTRVPVPKDLSLPDCDMQVLDPYTLEVSIDEGEDLNGIFRNLGDRKVQVTSMRPKANRLEELFLTLTAGGEQ